MKLPTLNRIILQRMSIALIKERGGHRWVSFFHELPKTTGKSLILQVVICEKKKNGEKKTSGPSKSYDEGLSSAPAKHFPKYKSDEVLRNAALFQSIFTLFGEKVKRAELVVCVRLTPVIETGPCSHNKTCKHRSHCASIAYT